jgi:hypothetical protein
LDEPRETPRNAGQVRIRIRHKKHEEHKDQTSRSLRSLCEIEPRFQNSRKKAQETQAPTRNCCGKSTDFSATFAIFL